MQKHSSPYLARCRKHHGAQDYYAHLQSWWHPHSPHMWQPRLRLRQKQSSSVLWLCPLCCAACPRCWLARIRLSLSPSISLDYFSEPQWFWNLPVRFPSCRVSSWCHGIWAATKRAPGIQFVWLVWVDALCPLPIWYKILLPPPLLRGNQAHIANLWHFVTMF